MLTGLVHVWAGKQLLHLARQLGVLHNCGCNNGVFYGLNPGCLLGLANTCSTLRASLEPYVIISRWEDANLLAQGHGQPAVTQLVYLLPQTRSKHYKTPSTGDRMDGKDTMTMHAEEK